MLPVLREFNVVREWYKLRIMRHHGVEVSVYEAFEAGAVTGARRTALGASRHSQR